MELEKSCLFCKHFHFNMGSPAYSELTPGEDAVFSCNRNHFEEISNYGTGSREEFVNSIKTAEKCKDFWKKQ